MDNTLTLHIIRSSRSSIGIEINSQGEVIVKAPFFTPQFVIKAFMKHHEQWIIHTREKINKRHPVAKMYKEGEAFYFLGKSYVLSFYQGTEINLADKLYMPKAMAFRAAKELQRWYVVKGKEIITKRVLFHADIMKASYKNLLFSDTKSKWGTCFPDNMLQFNWRLVMAPLMVLDYVVIHELVHTTKKHHQASFWSKVRLYTPAYKQHQKWLHDHAHLLHI